MHRPPKPYPSPYRRDRDVAPRYRRVLALLSQGKDFRAIAAELNIQPVTAWQYIEDIMIKNRDLCPRLAAYALDILNEAQDNAR